MKLFTSILFTVLMGLMISAAAGANPYVVTPIVLTGAVLTNFVQLPAGILAAKIGDMAASTTTTLQIQYVPEFITFEAATVPTALKVEVLGEGTLMNLDAAGCDIMNDINALGTQANRYTFQLADGLVKGKTVEITMTNAVAAAVSVYGFSPDGLASLFAIYQKNTILADSGKDLSKFAVLGFDSPTADDIFIMEMTDGTQDKLSIEEIDAYQTQQQNYDPSAAGLIINNTEQNYRKVNITPSTNRVVYVLNFQPIGNIENQVA